MNRFADTRDYITTILYKEWLELRQESMLIWSLLIPTLIMTILPIVMVTFIGNITDLDADSETSEDLDMLQDNPLPEASDTPEDLGMMLGNPMFADMSMAEAFQSSIGIQFSILMMLLPLIIPNVIAAYSIVGEKTRRTLEPLLATPVTTIELLLGKALAALIPTIAITWLCAGIFALAMLFVTLTPAVFAAIISTAWIMIILFCTPFMALIVIAATVAISSRVNDPRSAQQITALMIVPLMLIFFGQVMGVIVLSPLLVLIATLVLALLAVLTIWVAVRLFERETILTRWR